MFTLPVLRKRKYFIHEFNAVMLFFIMFSYIQRWIKRIGVAAVNITIFVRLNIFNYDFIDFIYSAWEGFSLIFHKLFRLYCS